MRRGTQMEHGATVDEFAKWFLVFTAAFWVGIVGLKSLAGGWHRLAERFRTSAPAEGETFRFASMYIRSGRVPVSYGNCLFITAGHTGMRLSVFFPFRLLHPPLFIPWSAVETVLPEEFGRLTHTAVRLRGVDTHLLFPEPVGRRLAEAFNARYSTMPA